ncbi:DUF3048 family protein [Natranaerovirga pectinivora]|uniref:DUF3048 family protein n=1 Tax=Natranaerovirga pectinivora TaxID=682400 RepID=A0A4R3MTM4_9FIRM|nr:DUF3048 domain-containing protein [Natranaerovirga pectinivora]TCT17060.1 DUF3048 family protein [Natranaerovirga pectinivora]
MKNILRCVLVLLTIFVFVGCGGRDSEIIEKEPIVEEIIEVEEEEEEEEIEEIPEGMAINPLTGLWIDEEAANRRPISIMINNLGPAVPQSGIAQADIFYETLVEGGITRLLAIFQDFNAEKIGPVRSARHYFLDYAYDHDALYVHYGQSPQANVAFRDRSAPNLNGLSYLDTIMCFRDHSRVAPHNTYTSFNGLMAAWDRVGYRTNISDEFESKLHFFEEETIHEDGKNAIKVTLPYSNNTIYRSIFKFDADKMEYRRYHRGGTEPFIDKETGDQLHFKNIIVQYTEMWVIPGDTEHRMDQRLVSEGNGYYISNGKAIEISWKRDDMKSTTKYFDKNENELMINKGKTWIAIFPNNREIILE